MRALSRRSFLGSGAAAAAGALAAGWPGFPERLPPTGAASDEEFWIAVQRSFNVDRSIVHLNNGGVCPSPSFVQDAETAHRFEANRHPFYAHEAAARPQIESVRACIADLLGCDTEEVALTRNTSEGMEIVQLGFPLGRGDEVVTTSHDYPRMLNTWAQRAAREGAVVRHVDVPVPLDNPRDLVEAIDATITSRTKLVMCCHIVDLTGQVLPVRGICEAAHRRGVPVLVDGAQSFGQFDFTVADLGCDFFATSLHKWLMGPQGTGALYVRRDLIPDVWPLMPAAPEAASDIRKFEDIGTASHAPALALAEAMNFHAAVGAQRKGLRLRFLRDYWLQSLLNHDRVSLRTNTRDAWSLATIDVDGVEPVALRNHLWEKHRIRVRPIDQSGVRGIRVSPSIYNTTNELDRLVEVLEDVITNRTSIT